ncbi:MAG: PAS domain S-box protein, partial [Methylococcus sp.]
MLDQPIRHDITLPNGQWVLSMAPVAGWQDYREWITRFGLGMLFSGLLGALVASRTRSLIRLRLTEQMLRERQAIEAELQRRTFLLESAQREARIGYFVTDLRTGCWTGSPMLEEIMGIDERYPRSVETWEQLVHADDRQRARQEYERAIRRQENLHHQYRIIRPSNGEVCWVDAWGSHERENGQPVRLIGTLKDITEATQARLELERHRDQLEQRVEERTQALSVKTQELERATERLQLAMEGTRLGIWEWNVPTRDLRWSLSTEDILGYESGQFESSLDSWLNLLPSEEREQVLADKLADLDATDFCELDYRLRGSDGDYRWVHDRGRVTRRGPQGQPERVVGTIQDITPRKEAELALQDSELRYRALSASLEDKVAKRTAQLAAASAAKTQFLAHMSHE